MYPRWVLHLIDAVIVFFTVDIISSVGIMATPLSFIQQYQSYVFHTIALRFFHILHHNIGTNVSPLLYAELALKTDGLQEYVDAMNLIKLTYSL